MNKAKNKFLVFGIYLVLAITTLVVFFQVRHFEFINYDDDRYVTENRHVLTGLTGENIIWAFTANYAANWHPLTWLSHMLDCQLFKAAPGGHHLTNLLFHIINTLLLFTVLRQITGAIWPSAFVAAVFALHPLHVESVAWISERKDVISAMFWFLTMIAYARYTKHQNVSMYLLTLVLFALGLMAKPMLVTLPFVLLLIDFWPFERKGLRHLLLEKVPFFALSAASCIVTFIVQQSGGAVAPIVKLPLNMRLTNCLISYVKYIQKTIWPSDLAVFYPHPLNTIPEWQLILTVLLLSAISVLAVALAARCKYLLVGWLWYLGTLIPVIGLVQVGEQAWADRYSYIPLIGLFIIIAWGFYSLLKKVPVLKTVIVLLALIITAIFSAITFSQLRYWRNSETLFGHALAATENNYVAHYCLGNWLFNQGKTDEAVAHYYQTLQINPDYILAHISLGVALDAKGRLNDAIEQFQYVMKLNPGFAEAYYNLGIALASQGKYDDALRQYRKTVELNPDYVKAYSNMGIILSYLGKFDEAIVCYQKALRLKPDYAEAYNNLGTTLSAQGKFDEAIGQFNQALRLKPNAVNALCNLGYTLARQGKLDEGIANLTEVIKLNPNFSEAHCYLAMALAKKGQIDEAIKHAEIALKLSQAAGNRQLAEQIQKNLDSYKSQQK